MQRIWNDRLVLSTGEVVMPEQVKAIDIPYSTITYDNGDDSGADMLIDAARLDRCTGLPDRTGKTIYERDRVKKKNRPGYIYYDTGLWRICWDDVTITNSDLRDWYKQLEVIGYEQYPPEGSDAR